MLGTLALLAMVSLSKAERDTDFDASPHNTLHDCRSEPLTIGECRMPVNLTAQDAETHLAGKDTAWWRENDEFIVVARRDTDQAYLCCSARGKMDHIGGDLWAIRLDIVDLDHATIDVFVKPDGATSGVYRGLSAPPRLPVTDKLQGKIFTVGLKSQYLDGPRNVLIYLPPNHDPAKTYPVVYMADGVFRTYDPGTIEPFILNGELPPMILVGLYPGGSAEHPMRRSEEYLEGWPNSGNLFIKHEAFLMREVMPLIEQKCGGSNNPDDRIVTGFSSGAAWAVSMGSRHPELFHTVIAQSLVWPFAQRDMQKNGPPRYFLYAGTLEPKFYAQTLRFADEAKAAGHDVHLDKGVSGHTTTIWRGELIDALKWAFHK